MLYVLLLLIVVGVVLYLSIFFGPMSSWGPPVPFRR